MSIRFVPIGTPRSVERRVLRFETQADFDKAISLNEEVGFLRFRNGEGRNLVGSIVRIAPSKFVIEVDAAQEQEEGIL